MLLAWISDTAVSAGSWEFAFLTPLQVMPVLLCGPLLGQAHVHRTLARTLTAFKVSCLVRLVIQLQERILSVGSFHHQVKFSVCGGLF